MDKINALFQYLLMYHMNSMYITKKLDLFCPKITPLLNELQPLIPNIIQWINMMMKKMICQHVT